MFGGGGRVLIHREAFLRFFVALLAGYRRFLVYPTKANPSPVRLFNTNDFLEKLDRDTRPFAEAMCDTQARTDLRGIALIAGSIEQEK